MMSLAGKKIVLGVSGGIAAYKTPELVRRLRDRPASFHPARREYGYRFQTECEPVVPAPRDEHDPMRELEGGDA